MDIGFYNLNLCPAKRLRYLLEANCLRIRFHQFFLQQLAVVGITLRMLLPELTAIATLAEGLTILRGQAIP